ncbi:MAG: RimK family alpha-L-glutamate ligase [Candidatus Woesearchaeota archaeon]
MVKLKAALISLGSVSSKWTVKAMEKYFDEVDDLDLREIEVNLGKGNFEVLYAGKPLGEYDCVYAKGSFRYESILRALATALNNKSYMPNKPISYTIGHDKLLTHLECMEANIPMPGTYLASSSKGGKKILEKLNYPIVMKFPQGTQGKGVMFADSYNAAVSVLDALTALKQPLIIQEYIETEGTDIRSIVVGDKVVASMCRKAEKGEKRANIHAGAKGEACILDSRTKKVAIDTAKTISAEICAVDILESAKGPMMIEANLSPGLQGITAATNVDVADKIAKYLFGRTIEFKNRKGMVDSGKILEEVGIQNTDSVKDMIINNEMRGERILLPKIVSKISDIGDGDEISISIKRREIEIKKL